MKRAFIWLAGCLGAAGCGVVDNTPPPTFVGGQKYAVVVTNMLFGGVPCPDTKTLCYYSDGPNSSRNLIWPMLTAKNVAVFDQLAVFSGGTSGDLTWEFYPELFAYSGSGSVVDISLLACPRIPGWNSGWTNYGFSLVGVSNNQVRLDVRWRGRIDPTKPNRLEVVLDRSDILNAVQQAQTNATVRAFAGVKYRIAE